MPRGTVLAFVRQVGEPYDQAGGCRPPEIVVKVTAVVPSDPSGHATFNAWPGEYRVGDAVKMRLAGRSMNGDQSFYNTVEPQLLEANRHVAPWVLMVVVLVLVLGAISTIL